MSILDQARQRTAKVDQMIRDHFSDTPIYLATMIRLRINPSRVVIEYHRDTVESIEGPPYRTETTVKVVEPTMTPPGLAEAVAADARARERRIGAIFGTETWT